MIKIPINVYPRNTVIDPTKNNNFEFMFAGDNLIAYQIFVYISNTNTSVFISPKIDCNYYNGEIIKYEIPKNKLPKNKSLIWTVRQWENPYNNLILKARVTDTLLNGSLVINRTTVDIVEDMEVIVNETSRKIEKLVDGEINNGIITLNDAFLTDIQVGDKIKITKGSTQIALCEVILAYNNSTFIINYNDNIEEGMKVTNPNAPTEILDILLYEQQTIETSTIIIKESFDCDIPVGTYCAVMSNFIDSPVQYFFKSKVTPTIDILNVVDIVTTNSFEFIGNYISDNISLKYHMFNIYDIDFNVIQTSGKVYSSNLRYSYDGFVNNKSYFVELVGETVDNVMVFGKLYPFKVKYTEIKFGGEVEAEFLCDTNSVMLKWNEDNVSEGSVNGSYEYINNTPFFGSQSIDIKTGKIHYSNIGINPLNIKDDDFTVFLSIIIKQGKEGEIIKLVDDDNNEYKLELSGFDFYRVKNNIRTKLDTSIIDGEKTSCFGDGHKSGYTYVLMTNTILQKNTSLIGNREVQDELYKISIYPNKIDIIKAEDI